MEKFVKGDVVVVHFPFSDMSGSKKRPALVVAELEGDDLILCQITSQARLDSYAIILNPKDFEGIGLSVICLIRPNKIFTADKSLVVYRKGSLKSKKMKEVTLKICSIFTK